jgi:DNA sulfur modification protein DndC
VSGEMNRRGAEAQSQTFWDAERMTMTGPGGAIDLTVQSLNAYGPNYNHWVMAFSGGKDSTAVATLVPHLISKGLVPRPKSLTVLYADTRMELPPLQISAIGVLRELRRRGIETRVVLPELDDRFFVYLFGRGVPPPSNTFRWCTPQLKIEPMVNALRSLRDQHGEKFLMLTGVRVGESAARDQRIALSCSKDGAECGQGWFQVSTPQAVADTLAPLLHWRVCLVWKWLRDYAPSLGFPTEAIADAYGGDEAEEVNARTGCVGCNLASRDTALETILKNERWARLHPLMRLRPLYAELKKPHNRLRKDGSERRKDGELVANPQRMGPLTFEARLWGLEQVLSIQREAVVDLINEEEEDRIRELIRLKTWPQGWDGTEPRADVVLDEVLPCGAVQPVFFKPSAPLRLGGESHRISGAVTGGAEHHGKEVSHPG